MHVATTIALYTENMLHAIDVLDAIFVWDFLNLPHAKSKCKLNIPWDKPNNFA